MVDEDTNQIHVSGEVHLTGSERRAACEDSGCSAGCVVVAVILISIGVGGALFSGQTGEVADKLIGRTICVGLVLAAIAGIVSFNVLCSRAKEKARQAKLAELVRAASKVEEEVKKRRNESAKLVDELPSHLDATRELLSQARAEFSESAFGPFWDAVEQATIQLGTFKRKVEQLAQYASRDEQVLGQWKHTFSPFPVTSSMVPDPSLAIAELREVVRLGQTSFEFSSIWEQRKTREVLIDGFENLGQAVVQLGEAVAGSVSQLESTVARDLEAGQVAQEQTQDMLHSQGKNEARLLEGHGRSLERIERKLDR